MSLLARRNVSIRDAMRIMGWKSMEMVRLYERELEKAKMDADKRTLKLVEEIEEFNLRLPEAVETTHRLQPTKEKLTRLSAQYSNIAIGRIYGMTEAAVRKWMVKLDVKRQKRIESPELTDGEISRIRAELE